MYFIFHFNNYFFYPQDNTSGDLIIQGPLRIYWGVNKPIQLQQFDNVPSNVPETNWRHSFIPGSHNQTEDKKVPDIASLVSLYVVCL